MREKEVKCAWCKECVEGLCLRRGIEVDADALWEPPCFKRKRKPKQHSCKKCKWYRRGWCKNYQQEIRRKDKCKSCPMYKGGKCLNYKCSIKDVTDNQCDMYMRLCDRFLARNGGERYAKPVQHLHCYACPNSYMREDGMWFCTVKETAVYKHDWCVLSPTTKPGKRVKSKDIEKFKGEGNEDIQ